METLKLTTDLKEIPVVLTTKGVNKDYVLREFDGEARQGYMGNVLGAVDVELDAKAIQEADTDEEAAAGVTVKSLKGADLITMQTDLVGLCLFEKDAKESCPIEFVKGLPVATIEALYKACQELNVLGAKEKAKVKN